MKKLLLMFALAFASLVFAAEPQAPQGTGKQDDPYQIATYENLLWMGSLDTEDYSYAVLADDIDASKSVDEDEGLDLWFFGSLDGQNHTIYDLVGSYYLEEFDGEIYEEIYGAFEFSGELSNINFEGKKQKCAFAWDFCGSAKNIKVTNGGLVRCDGDGEMYYGTIENVEITDGFLADCCYECTIQSVVLSNSVLVCDAYEAYIENVVANNSPCFIAYAEDTILNQATVTGNVDSNDSRYLYYEDIGGCIGGTDCCVISNVAVNVNIFKENTAADREYEWDDMGGIVAYDYGSTKIVNSYFAGKIEGTAEWGVSGIVGGLDYDEPTTVVNCYFDAVNAPTNGFGTAVSNAELKSKATFENWDFENVWVIDEFINYPQLRFTGATGTELIVSGGTSKASISVKGTLSDNDLQTIQENPEVCLLITESGVELTSRYELEEGKNQKFSYKKKEEGVKISYTGKNKTLKFNSTSPLVTLGKKANDSYSPCELTETKMKVTATVKNMQEVSANLKEKDKLSIVESDLTGGDLSGTVVKLTEGKNKLSCKQANDGTKFTVKINTAKKTVQIKYSGNDAVQPAVWHVMK